MATRSYTVLTLKRLFGLSGNRCAFPECQVELVNQISTNPSNICHIAALNEGGPRFNARLDPSERNDYSNLILLCRNHHSIIDEKDSAGNTAYSVEQLKAMKDNHENLVRQRWDFFRGAPNPSILANVISALSESNVVPDSAKPSHAPRILNKIEYNNIFRYKQIIAKYAAYSIQVRPVYDALGAGEETMLLESINDRYLKCDLENHNADEILDEIQTALLEQVLGERPVEWSEQLEYYVKIIMVDAFIRCKILETPPQ